MKTKNNTDKGKDWIKGIGKIPPNSLEAEQALLGGLLISNSQYDIIAQKIVSGDFYYASHKLIYKAIEILYESKQPIDLITLTQYLEKNNEIDKVGGFSYLAEITQNTPSAANIESYADIIKENAILRSVIEVAQEIANLGLDPSGKKSDNILDIAESKIFEIANKRKKGDSGPIGVDILVPESIEILEKLYNNPDKSGITGLATGFTDLDRKTYGLQKCDLIILAARPSMGKTTLAMNFCEHVLLNQNLPVLVFSLEMPRYQLMSRLLSSLSRVEQSKLRSGKLTDEDWSRLASSHSLLMHRKNLFIDDSSFINIPELRARSRRIFREYNGLALIMVDYLQLMKPATNIETRALEVAHITSNLKGLAKELAVPIIALSQLNRGLEQRSDKRPLLADLRESGSIEQDADLVLFIYRDEIYSENSDQKGVAEIIIGKHRNGPVGTIKLTFQSQYARFENHAER